MATPTIEELVARLAEQQARIELLEARSSGNAEVTGLAFDPAEPGQQPEPGQPDHRTGKITRRGMIKTATVGAAGLVGAMLIEPEAANATTTGPASFTSSSATTPAVKATNTGKGLALVATAAAATAIHGSQTGTGAMVVALRGTIDGTNGAGTGVVGASPAGTGVRGTSDTGFGVDATSGSTVANAAAILGTITSTSPGSFSAGVRGISSGTGGAGVGVYGSHGGSGYGVYGFAPTGFGLYGQSNSGVGVLGTATAGGYGVYGYTGDGNGYGVYGSASAGVGVYGNTSTGTAIEGAAGSGVGVRGSSSSSGYGVYGSSGSSYGTIGSSTNGNGVYGQISTAPQAGVVGRQTDASGNWAVYGFGNIGATGTKSAVVPAQDGNGHMTLYCMESPECWFEDFGSATLSGGSAHVRIDAEFAQTVHVGEYHVFLQAEGDCAGLAVWQKTATGFVVRELGGGAGNASFSYRIVARRRDVAAPRLNRITLPDAPVVEVVREAPQAAPPRPASANR